MIDADRRGLLSLMHRGTMAAVKKLNFEDRGVLVTLVFVSALFGLFFSNAEGVTLLPFPDPAPGQFSSFKKGASKTPYNQGLTSARTTPSKRTASDAPTDGAARLPVPPRLQIPRYVEPRSAERPYPDPVFYAGRSAGGRPVRGPPSA